MKYSKGLSNLLQNKTIGSGRGAGERRGGRLHLVDMSSVSPVAERGTQGECCLPMW